MISGASSGGNKQQDGLDQALEQHLVRQVHRRQPDPVNITGSGMIGVGGALQAVAQDFMQDEMLESDLGERGLAGVEPQADLAADAVDPVSPVVIDVVDLDRHLVGGRRPGERPEYVRLRQRVSNTVAGVVEVDRLLDLDQILVRARSPPHALTLDRRTGALAATKQRLTEHGIVVNELLAEPAVPEALGLLRRSIIG